MKAALSGSALAGAGAAVCCGAGAGGASLLVQPMKLAAASAAASAACFVRDRFMLGDSPLGLMGTAELPWKLRQAPGTNGLPSEAGMLSRIQSGLREMSTSTATVA